jgi:hypothetical protein
MQLRVPRPRGPVHERRRQNSLGVDLAHPGLALAAERRVVLQIRQPGRHRRSVALTYRHADLATGGRPQRRHRLRRRERQIPARHPIGALPHPIRLPERLPRHRMAAIEQTRQLLGGHLAPQTRGGRAPPHPSPGRLAPARVVILQPDGDRVRVVRHGRSGHLPPAQHRPPPTRRRAAGTTTRTPGTAGCQCPRGFSGSAFPALRVPDFRVPRSRGFGSAWLHTGGSTRHRRPALMRRTALPAPARRAPLLCFATEAATGAES